MDRKDPFNGIINVYKESGFTSFDVVAKLRGILKMRRIGHTGTLDPAAEGVLPVALGKATRICDLLTEKTKVYEAVLRLGITTDTLDMEGTVLEEQPVCCSEEDIVSCISSFIGEKEQLPPMYSAVKIGGKRLYELAREGKTADRKPRKVIFHDIVILDISVPRVKIRVRCSKGTYIRTLCDDIGKKLGCGACLEHLVRTGSGQFDISSSLKLSEIEELVKSGSMENTVIPIDEALDGYKKIKTLPIADKNAYNGNKIAHASLEMNNEPADHEIVRLYDSADTFIGIYENNKSQELVKPVKILML